MARAETMESVCEAAAGAAGGPLPQYQHGSCHRVELPGSIPAWSSMHHLGSPGGPAPQTSSEQPVSRAAQSDERRPLRALCRYRRLPDLLPRGEHEFGDLLPAPQLDVISVGEHLRTIGDDFNASVLRAHAAAAPRWQDWIDAYRGFLNLAARTLSALYRLT
ncbi:bcl-2-binding component 3 [Nerophis lumbriciformis]|uniref:bcl-2-binding component 3 n=1 Tax=Nerophis lumbriciformis TaxID=546530 RepID=UPI003BA89BB3